MLSLFTTLEGRIPFGRFGHAMAKLGDINGDSYEGSLWLDLHFFTIYSVYICQTVVLLQAVVMLE